jgi:hypothetical protein
VLISLYAADNQGASAGRNPKRAAQFFTRASNAVPRLERHRQPRVILIAVLELDRSLFGYGAIAAQRFAADVDISEQAARRQRLKVATRPGSLASATSVTPLGSQMPIGNCTTSLAGSFLAMRPTASWGGHALTALAWVYCTISQLLRTGGRRAFRSGRYNRDSWRWFAAGDVCSVWSFQQQKCLTPVV